ncbi:MAG: glycosyltransferase family 2 protein [Chitinophagaceae bacterium]|nr:glycosyltransferase family 2 protein [Chitinophagaceae bacterium]
MKVVGFTFIRNAIKYDYPVEEAIRSILPLCDEVIVNVGNSDDGTAELISRIDPTKIKMFHSTWDEKLIEGGRVLAAETDKAYEQVPDDADWCIYIQADEVIHEKYYPVITAAMKKYRDEKKVEGLLFKYLHFYGSYDYVGDTRKWYSHEIRIIRKDNRIHSYRDAQGFRIEGRKLQVAEIDAYIYHYGWVRHPLYQMQKVLGFEKLYDSDNMANRLSKEATDHFDYSDIDSLTRFAGSHPVVMRERIAKKNWTFEHDISRKKFTLKGRVLHWIENVTGKRLFDYRNYHIIR